MTCRPPGGGGFGTVGAGPGGGALSAAGCAGAGTVGGRRTGFLTFFFAGRHLRLTCFFLCATAACDFAWRLRCFFGAAGAHVDFLRLRFFLVAAVLTPGL